MVSESSVSLTRSPNITGKKDLQYRQDHNRKPYKTSWRMDSKRISWSCTAKIITIDTLSEGNILTNLSITFTKDSCFLQNTNCHWSCMTTLILITTSRSGARIRPLEDFCSHLIAPWVVHTAESPWEMMAQKHWPQEWPTLGSLIKTLSNQSPWPKKEVNWQMTTEWSQSWDLHINQTKSSSSREWEPKECAAMLGPSCRIPQLIRAYEYDLSEKLFYNLQ